jgi:hypothetical protein
MKHKTFVIERHWMVQPDARPPRKGEGIGWVDCSKRIWTGFICKVLWGDSCMGGKGIDIKKHPEQYELALNEIKATIDDTISSVMQSCNVDEKEAIKLLKES